MKIPKPLADAAYKVIVARHKHELKSDLKTICQTLGRLMMRGISERDLMEVLHHDHWESKLSKHERQLPPWDQRVESDSTLMKFNSSF